MEQKMIIWSTVVVLLVVVFAAKGFSDFYKGKKHKLIEMGSETEMFYCPGDPRPSKDDED